MANTKFLHQALDDGRVRLELWEMRSLRSSIALPFTDWIGRLEPRPRAALGPWLEELENPGGDKPRVAISDDGAALVAEPGFAASLEEPDAVGVGLPPAAPYQLELASRGTIDRSDFLIDAHWNSVNGMRAFPDPDRRGALLASGGEAVHRLPEPMFSILEAVDRVNVAGNDDLRIEALAVLTALLPEDAAAKVRRNGYLDRLRVHYAARFSLDVEIKRDGEADDVTVDPVLFARGMDDGSGDPPDEGSEALLPPSLQRLFAQERFKCFDEARPAYPLREGSYVFLDPALHKALNVVREAQRADAAARRRLATDPRRVIREALGDDAAVDLEALFVETQQYSARVAGIDAWRTPVLPWLKPDPNTWLPETFGVRIGDDTWLKLDPEKLCDAIEKVHEAIERGEALADVDGTPVPATDQALQTLRDLQNVVEDAEAKKAASDDGIGADTDETKARAEKLFLIVRENFEDVTYAPFEPRTPAALASEVKVDPPSMLRTALKPHQLDGLRWLANAHAARHRGVLLADDMGLGKTLQVLALLAWLRSQCDERSTSPALVVAPVALLGAWAGEIRRHFVEDALGELVRAYGSELRRMRREDGAGGVGRDTTRGAAVLDPTHWRDAGVVLTTYETLRDYHMSFAKARFAVVVFDEAQKLKNPAAQVTRAAETLNGDFFIAMTGTPVENRLHDLWSIMDVVQPGFLGSSRGFETSYPATDREALRALHTRLIEPQGGRPPVMLRRAKEDSLEALPKKYIHRQEMPMPPPQARAYAEVVNRAQARRAAMGRWDGMLETLHALRGVSLHPTDPRLGSIDDLESYAAESARLAWTLEKLDEIAAKSEKALVFCENIAMQQRLAALLRSRYRLPREPMRIWGDVPGPRRQELVDRFNAERGRFDVMILSPKAGGVGLTLTAANHVIHLSRWWNPAVEDQSTDRIYRIGQDKDVHVYLPLAVHPDPEVKETSFDLRLDALLERKRALSRDMLCPPEAGGSDIERLFGEVTEGPPIETSVEVSPPAAATPTPRNGGVSAGVVLEIGSELDGPAVGFGARFRDLLAEQSAELDTVLSADVLSLHYSDRYLFSPLAVLLAVELLAGLANDGTHLTISTWVERRDRGGDRGPQPKLIWHDWPDLAVRTRVLERMLADVSPRSAARAERFVVHRRKLEFETARGSGTIFLEHGIGPWRAASPRTYDFRAPVADQVASLHSPLSVAVVKEGTVVATRLRR